MSISEIKNEALSVLKGQWTNPVLTVFLVGIVSAVAGSVVSFIVPVVGGLAATILVSNPFAYGMALSFYDLGRTKNANDMVGKSFNNAFNDYGRSISVSFFVMLFTFLWGLLFVIPGIIKGYAYSMTYFISKDNPELSARECMAKSEKMMDGYKMDYFLLSLSFIGWILLAMLTLGIGMFWVVPYIQTANVIFYQKLKGGMDAVNADSLVIDAVKAENATIATEVEKEKTAITE